MSSFPPVVALQGIIACSFAFDQKISFNESELSLERETKENQRKPGQFKVHMGLIRILANKMEGKKETISDISMFLLEAVSSVF